jgi:uncharacterized membrane protein
MQSRRASVGAFGPARESAVKSTAGDQIIIGGEMTESASSSRELPDHVDEAVRSIAQLHSEHHEKATAPQRLINRLSAVIARPHFVAFLTIGVCVWIGANLAAIALGRYAPDPPPFLWLVSGVNLLSLLIVALVLVAQKHEDELNARREILTLELALLSERKIAKVIELLEELRRDSPHIADRLDPQAEQMAQPADAQSVLAAAEGNDQ